MTSAAADYFASYTRCNGDSFLRLKNDNYALKNINSLCILVKLLTHYISGNKRTDLAISKRVEVVALNGFLVLCIV